MIPLSVLEKHLQHLSNDKIEIILEIRNIVAKLVPHADERLDRKGISYFDSTRGGPVKAGICQINFKPDYLWLSFIHGAFLPDPAHLLQGECLAKRYMVLTKYEDIPWESVTALITASSHFDPMTLVNRS